MKLVSLVVTELSAPLALALTAIGLGVLTGWVILLAGLLMLAGLSVA